jgi:enterochelin esterase-like enzyme
LKPARSDVHPRLAPDLTSPHSARRTSPLHDPQITIRWHGVAVPEKARARGIMTPVPDLNRRAALRVGAGAGAAAVGAWALSALLDPLEPHAAPPQAPAPFEPRTAGSLPTKLTGSFISAARGGVKTNWVIALPPGQSGMLRPVIALHGKDGNANMMLEAGVEDGLAQLVKAGKPPFAVVGVDGGNTYWHRRASGGDSGAMVLEELLPMLSSMGMDVSRVGFMGWSMGGYGALRLGAILGPARTAGICAISPALFTSFTGSAPGAFDSYDDWVQNSVLGLPALSQIPLRVDCGTGDRFCFATRQFVNQLKKPPAGSFSAGGHDMDYWREQLPSELAWMAS